MNLVEAFLAHVEARPDARAIVTPMGDVVSYAELARRSGALARAYQRAGIGAGDVVLVARGVSPELYVALLALFRLGAVAMFPEPAAGLAGLGVAIEAARPKAMAGGALARNLRLISPALDRLRLLPNESYMAPADDLLTATRDDAPALITFTSGSTGRPKGIVRSAGFLMLQHELLEHLRATQPSDVDLISLPVFILSNLAVGATSVIPFGDLRRPAKLKGALLREQMIAQRVNRIVAPPAVCARIAHEDALNARLSAIFTGGGPVFPNLLRSLAHFAPRARIVAVYGSTEAEPIAHLDLSEIAEADWRAMSEGGGLLAGTPIAEIDVALVNEEVQVSGAHVNRGYLNAADNASTKVERDGVLWHRTGDAARRDEQGRLWLLGRVDAASNGLYPFAIETAALSWPGVKQAALLAEAGRARLAIAADIDADDARARARKLGDVEVVMVRAVPMDKRHNSKVDYARLRTLLG